MIHRHIRGSLYDYGKGELGPAQMKSIEAHLARCNSCYAEYQLVKEATRLVAPPRRLPSATRSSEYWAHFAVSVEARARVGTRRLVTTNPVIETLLSLLSYRRSMITASTAIAALVLAALFAWSNGMFPHGEVEELAGSGNARQVDPLGVELADYYRKSKILLVGISNIDPELGQRVDLSVERQAAQQLVLQTRYLDTKELDERSRALVRALERILIELANMEQLADLKDVDIVRAGIHQENMLFKIRMAESDYSAAWNGGILVEN